MKNIFCYKTWNPIPDFEEEKIQKFIFKHGLFQECSRSIKLNRFWKMVLSKFNCILINLYILNFYAYGFWINYFKETLVCCSFVIFQIIMKYVKLILFYAWEIFQINHKTVNWEIQNFIISYKFSLRFIVEYVVKKIVELNTKIIMYNI